MNPLFKAYWIGKGVGWDNIRRRLLQAYRLRTGWLRSRLEPSRFSSSPQLGGGSILERWAEKRTRFFPTPSPEQLKEVCPEALWQATVDLQCKETLNGNHTFFSHWTGQLGWPPNFNRDPVNEIDWPVGEHWLDTARSGPPRNDIKLVWEASRFSFAYTLARQYSRTRNDIWSKAFWEMYEAWRVQNPVNLSVAWGCGQEIAFRCMAMLTAAITMLESSETTKARLQDLELACWQFGKRIAVNINYAISQKNNHGLSEALGLWTLGLLFPEWPEAKDWLMRGKKILEVEVARQIQPDGSYAQNSMSYHRVMLDDMSWAIGLGNINAYPLSEATVCRVGKSVEWLRQFCSSESGRVPNYGANDGANVLPLSSSDYLDYRPTLQAAANVCGMTSGLGIGPWSEKTLWLSGELPRESVADSKRPNTWQASHGGYFIMRGDESYGFVRAVTHKQRPSQCDLLHFDLWWKGQNILRDAGSFRYYHEDRDLKEYFYSSQAHNTVWVDGADQMVKGPNFLWLKWPRCGGCFKSETRWDGWADFSAQRPYRHERSIEVKGCKYIVYDVVAGVDRYALRWRLEPSWLWHQVSPSVVEGTSCGARISIELVTEKISEIALTKSYESLYYGEVTECPTIELNGISGTVETHITLLNKE